MSSYEKVQVEEPIIEVIDYNPNLESYVVESESLPGTQWTIPKHVFEEEYEAVRRDFSWALRQLKEGRRVRRKGWNGKDMWIALGGTPVELEAEKFWNPHARSWAEENEGTAQVEGYILMKTAQGTIQMGWIATQSDILAEDWEVVNYD